MKEIKRFDVTSVALIFAVMYAVLGFFVGFMFALMSIPAIFIGEEGLFFLFIGIIMVIVMPVFYGVIGLASGGIFGLVYNRVAASIGGIKMELK